MVGRRGKKVGDRSARGLVNVKFEGRVIRIGRNKELVKGVSI